MTKSLDTTADATGATACKCSEYEAQIPEQHTPENLANGSYDTFSTGCQATTKREFAPGHDAKLKSFLIQHGAQDHLICHGITHGPAESFAKQYTFGYMVVEGIAKAKEKMAAKADRAAAKAAKPATKKAAKKPTEAPALADIVAAEEAAHVEAELAKAAEREQSADWDNAPEGTVVVARVQDSIVLEDAPTKVAEVTTPVILEDEGAMNAHAQDAREAAGLVKAKVGRWTQEGYVNEDGSFTFAKRGGGTKTVGAGKYTLV